MFKSAAILSAAILLAKISGFAREVVLAAFFGAGTVSDAFILAFSIPDILLVLVSASVAGGYIPMYYRVEEKVKFTRNIMTCLLIAGFVFSIVFTIFPGALVRLFAFRIEPETFETASFFLRYMVWTAVFMLLADVFGARLEIEGSFFANGMRSLWRNVVVIAGIILGAVTGFDIWIAVAPAAGTAIGTIVLAAACKRHGFTYKPYLDLRSPALQQLSVLAGPIFLSSAATQLNIIIARNFAATIGAGSVSHLYYAAKITFLFTLLMGTVFSVVLFPRMSKMAADGDTDTLKATLAQGVVYIFALMLPVSIGVFILAAPGVRILLYRGAFTAEDTLITAGALQMYAPILVAASITPLLLRAFHAMQNTKSPAAAGVISVAASVVFNFLFVSPMGVAGLALSGSISGIILVCLLFALLRKKIGSTGIKTYSDELAKIIFAAGAMGVVVYFAANALPLMYTTSSWYGLLLIFVPIAGGIFVYGGLLLALQSNIAHEVVRRVRRKGGG